MQNKTAMPIRMTMRLTFAVAAAVIAFSNASHAEHPDAGTVAFPFLNMGYDARAVAMGGAAVAMPNDLYGVLSNPASVGFIGKTQIMGGYRQVITDVWGGPLGVSFMTKAMGGAVIAPYLVSVTTGEFDIVNESGQKTGQRAASTYTALGAAAAKTFGNDVSVGVAVKGLYHYIGAGSESYSAEGVAFDIGAQHRSNNNRLIYGAALRNFGVMRGYWDEWNEYDMPYGAEAGVSYVPRHIPNLRVAFDVNNYNGDYTNFEPAFEYAVIKNTLFLRGGYAFSSMDFEKMLEVFGGERDDDYQKSSINSLSLGAGFATVMDNVAIKLDAAIQFYTDVSTPSIIVSLLVAF